MPTIEETADAMFKSQHKFSIRNILSTYREISYIIKGLKLSENEKSVNNGSYNFTGQHTDIAFASSDNGLSIEAINSIKDTELRNNVMRNYSDAVQDGYLSFDNKTGVFKTTEKGNKHINSEAFKRQFEKDQSRALTENYAHIQLKGNKSDINVFRYTDELKLNRISCNPQDYKNIVSYFRQCEKYGFVTIKNNTVKPTEKCLRYLNQHKSQGFNISKLTQDNLSQVSKKLSEQAAKTATANTTKAAAKEAAKTVANEAAKATAKTAAKTAANAAAGTATAGTTVAVDAIIQLSKKGIDALNRVTDISHSKNTNNSRH